MVGKKACIVDVDDSLISYAKEVAEERYKEYRIKINSIKKGNKNVKFKKC